MSLRTGQTIGSLMMASLAGTLGITNDYLASAGIVLAAFFLVLAFVRQKRSAPGGQRGRQSSAGKSNVTT